jgi:hypothetical protein
VVAPDPRRLIILLTLGSVVALSAASAAIASGGPSLLDAPSVVGTATAGKRLTGLSGNWAGSGPISYRFQWYRCNAAGASCLVVHGATQPSYPLAPRDIGKTLGLTVYATDTTGTAAAFSSLVGPIASSRPLLESTAQPVVTGPPVEGKTLQVTTGAWSPTPPTLAYQWERCNHNGRACAAIPKATGSSYTIGTDDLGHALLAIVQGTNGATIQNAFSTASPAVVDGSILGPVSKLGPSVAGEPIVGQSLTATPGSWKGVGPIGFTYSWYRCDAAGAHCALRGSTRPTYKLGTADIGATIGLTLKASDATGVTTLYASLVGPVAAPTAPLAPTTSPTITGTAEVGAALTALPGQWSAVTTAYAYAWLRCNVNGRVCIPIAGATSASYTPTAADRHHTLVAQVKASYGHASQTAITAATAPVT